MELSSSDKERIQHQYDALAKKTLVGEAKSHRRTLAKRAAREVPFSDLSESELAQLFTTDEYLRTLIGIKWVCLYAYSSSGSDAANWTNFSFIR